MNKWPTPEEIARSLVSEAEEVEPGKVGKIIIKMKRGTVIEADRAEWNVGLEGKAQLDAGTYLYVGIGPGGGRHLNIDYNNKYRIRRSAKHPGLYSMRKLSGILNFPHDPSHSAWELHLLYDKILTINKQNIASINGVPPDQWPN